MRSGVGSCIGVRSPFSALTMLSASASARPPKSCDGTVSAAGDHDGDDNVRDRAVDPICGETASSVCVAECASEVLPDRLRGTSGRGSREYLSASGKNDACDDDEDVMCALFADANESDAWLSSDAPPSPAYPLRDA